MHMHMRCDMHMRHAHTHVHAHDMHMYMCMHIHVCVRARMCGCATCSAARRRAGARAREGRDRETRSRVAGWDGSRSLRAREWYTVLHVCIQVTKRLRSALRYKLYGVCLDSEIVTLEIIVHSVKIVSRAPACLLLMVALQHARAIPLQLFGATEASGAEEAVLVRVP